MTPEQEQDAERLCVWFCDVLPKQKPAEKMRWYNLTCWYNRDDETFVYVETGKAA